MEEVAQGAGALSARDTLERALGWATDFGSTLDRARYRFQQQGLALSLGVGGRLWSLMLSPWQPPPRRAVIAELQRRYSALLDRDLENVDRGYYPRELLHQFPLLEYLRLLPEALRDLPRFLWRSYRGQFDDLPPNAAVDTYPRYYLRTFHWQTDGWLSDRSARLYDAGVEFLFGGTADIMRRMAIPPIVEAVQGRTRPRVLDIGCGTGRFLLQLSRALPRAQLYGLDLSPYYLRRASEVLADTTAVSFVAENAESTPFADGFFDAVASIFLFHELPADVRRAVMREAWRLLKPGGRFVVCDSAQLAESADIKDVLLSFPATYHEPYYKGYLRDDLAQVMRECQFEVESSTPHLVSKVVVGRKPERAERKLRRRQGANGRRAR